MQTDSLTWVIGALVAALDAVLVVVVMIAIGAMTGRAFVAIGELIGLAFVESPRWLGPVIAGASILEAGLIGGAAARRGRESLFRAASFGVVFVVAAYVAWVFTWTGWRLAVGEGIGAAPLLPFEAALLAFAALLLPAIVLFLPAGLLWAWVVGVVLHSHSTSAGRTS